jgi:hypothetical protein
MLLIEKFRYFLRNIIFAKFLYFFWNKYLLKVANIVDKFPKIRNKN